MLKLINKHIKNVAQPKRFPINENNYTFLNAVSYFIYLISVGFVLSMALGISFEKKLTYSNLKIFSFYHFSFYYLGVMGAFFYIFTLYSPNNFYKIIRLNLNNATEIYKKSFQVTFWGVPFVSLVISIFLIPLFCRNYFENDFWMNLTIAYILIVLNTLLLTSLLTMANLLFSNDHQQLRPFILAVSLLPIILLFSFSQRSGVFFKDVIFLIFLLIVFVLISWWFCVFFLKKRIN